MARCSAVGRSPQMRSCIARYPAGTIARGRSTGPAERQSRRHHDHATDAQRRLEDHISAVPLHAGQFRGQDRGRPCRRADHDRAEASARTIRPARLLVLFPVLHLGHRGRLHCQSYRHALGSACTGRHMGARAVSDGRHGRPHHAVDLPRDPRRRRGAGVLGGGALGLQMVSRREAERSPLRSCRRGRHSA